MNYLLFKVVFKRVYELKIFTFLLFFTGISGCKLATGELKARESEGRLRIGSMNRAQQAYFLENNEFTTQLDIQPDRQNYDSEIIPQSDKTEGVMHVAQAKREDIKSYLGLVYAVKVEGSDYKITIAQVCESQANGSLSSIPEIQNLDKNLTKSEEIKCPSGFQSLNYTFETR
ncbi:MAG: type IV pilin-like G/H family protein [Cyanobacteria bacterium J06621_15]